MKNWNQRLAEVCAAKSITATELSRRCKVSVPTASDWLSGKIKNLEALRLLRVCDELSLDPWWLVTGMPKGKAPITEEKRPLSNEAKKLVLWVERADGLGAPSLKMLAHVIAALQVAESIQQAQHGDVVSELEEHQQIAAHHAQTTRAEKHAPRKQK